MTTGIFSRKWSLDGLPDLSGKTVFITGANSGIGKHTILELAKKNVDTIYLAGRNAKKCNDAIQTIQEEVPGAHIEFIQMDISKLDDVKSVADKFVAQNTSLNYLINNAGIMATPYELSVDGYEMQFATNYLGHALLSRTLLPLLEKTANEGKDVRIVNLTSFGHNFAPKAGIDFADINLTDGNIWERYGQSKLAQILFSKEFSKRYPKIKSYAVHPGFVRTDLYDGMNTSYGIFGRIANAFSKPFYLTPASGALNTLFCLSPEANGKDGEYLVPFGQVAKPSASGQNQELAKELWNWTTEELQKKKYLPTK